MRSRSLCYGGAVKADAAIDAVGMKDRELATRATYLKKDK